MQVFFAWVAAQKLSSCKQRIITSCTSGLHNKRYGSTHYDKRSASGLNLITVLIVFILRKSWYFTIFLFFSSEYAIIINNTVKCGNGLWQYRCDSLNALPSGRAFLYIATEEIFYACELKNYKNRSLIRAWWKKTPVKGGHQLSICH